jgi:hypothetical protein
MEPSHATGQSVTGAFDGWFTNPDGSHTILVGYYNRNTKEEVDIPIGPNNKIEPGGPDQGQPTHFLTGHVFGIFTVKVPKDFGDKRLTWSLTINGKTNVIPLDINTLWEISPFVDATNNTPPFIGFSAAGPFVQGPVGPPHATMTAVAGKPVPIEAWVADDANVSLGATRPRIPAVTVAWSKFRGPGDVTFSVARPPVEKAEFTPPPKTEFSGKVSTTATFSEPGQYVLRLVANDWSGDGGRGFQCCWSNGLVNVSVSK